MVLQLWCRVLEVWGFKGVPFLAEKHDLNLISFSPELARVVGKCLAVGSEGLVPIW